MPRYFAHLSYKGTHFHGWQLQPNADTVQERLNKALKTICRQDVETVGCGRTDTGVHATQFYAHFDLIDELKDPAHITIQLNAVLPDDIRVFELIQVSQEAHARFDATQRSYSYYILQKPDAFLYEYGWFQHLQPDIEIMNNAARLCLNREDFSCFSKSGGQQLTNNCHIQECRWIKEGKWLRFTVTSNRFLRGMVRAMVGTFLEVGMGKLSVQEFEDILRSGDRKQAGQAVPPHGLFLEEVSYPYFNGKRVFPFNK